MVNLIDIDQMAILLDRDGDKVEMWDHAPTETEIATSITSYRYNSLSPFVLFLAARKEVWEVNPDETDAPYKIFEQTNEVMKDSVKFGPRKVVVR